MSAKGSLRKVLFCAMLAMASMFGSPIRAEEIEKLMRYGNETQIVYTIGDGKDPPEEETPSVRTDAGDDPGAASPSEGIPP